MTPIDADSRSFGLVNLLKKISFIVDYNHADPLTNFRTQVREALVRFCYINACYEDDKISSICAMDREEVMKNFAKAIATGSPRALQNRLLAGVTNNSNYLRCDRFYFNRSTKAASIWAGSLGKRFRRTTIIFWF